MFEGRRREKRVGFETPSDSPVLTSAIPAQERGYIFICRHVATYVEHYGLTLQHIH
ncbi:hypothetical protein M378DRAFT_158227 [Amanita muscaria Koide BX008]|uniref:Uncharacterized protein n=1 Tax=Amanita muscaria (strain Koide BX008) TaxID=946122 RepID=A0A0C2X2Q8_AMAMK|nr:hypothetical protein M378DRAFT_158227 [Amanita muscaria Koide BX008]